MARPPSRRPGHNRKAQYGLFASYVIAVTGALIGLLLVVVSTFDPPGFALLRAGLAEVTRPVAAGFTSLTTGVGTIDEQVSAYINAGSQNAALRRQVDANRTRLIEAEAIAQENVRLKKLLNLAKDDAGRAIAARLISSYSGAARRVARLNAGGNQHVGVNMVVRAPEGLIGRVQTVGFNTADVLLITDPDNIVPLRGAKNNVAAISTGLGDGTLDIRPLNTGNNPFHPGDILVTSGTGGIYRPNIPVAIVIKTEGDSAIGVPLANPARVEIVLVQPVFQPTLVAPAPPVVRTLPANAAEGAR